MPTLADWRALVEKELAGAPFDKLVHATPEGVPVQPLYTEGPAVAPDARGLGAGRFGVCVRADATTAAEEIDGGADALWVNVTEYAAIELAASRGLGLILEADPTRRPDDGELREHRARMLQVAHTATGILWAHTDPIGAIASGRVEPRGRDLGLGLLPVIVRAMQDLSAQQICVSGLAFHDAGADAADELALMLSSAVAYLRALIDGGIAPSMAARALWTQIAVGRDTFGEVCKLRALRVCMGKLFAAVGAEVPPPPIHAVCAARTQSQHDPWVNMLRVTTEVFAAALGGATLITPISFDTALGEAGALGRRVARNTALVLREESHLGRVVDPAGGSYYIETRTDLLAREAWSRFTAIERDGGIGKLLASGALRDRLEASWQRRAALISKRKEPVLGVSEFANLGEQLPAAVPPPPAQPAAPALRVHRDAEGFDALRPTSTRHLSIVPLGPPAEHRARVGFAEAFFATAGLRAQELGSVPDIVCLCGSDERYALEAVGEASELRAAGARKIVLAGRPGALEAELRAAGVSAFIYLGCDVLATLTELTR